MEESNMRRRIGDSVVVITGASGGIGRATALRFAREGATLVIAARRERALHEVAEECRSLGGQALVVPLDVTNEQAVRDLARQAVENYGRIDVWVNNAAVTLFGRVEEAPTELYRRVLETNFFGYYYGIRSVLPYFREQGSGVLVNVASIVAEISQPYTSAYVASKFAIRALSDCVRMELALDDASGIHVCTVMPATIDTPLFNQAANYTGRGVKAMDPVLPAERVADAILSVAKCPCRETVVGGVGRMFMWMKRLMPGIFERVMAPAMDQNHLKQEPSPSTQGNLFEPMPEYATISGGWRPQDSGSGRWLLMGAVAVGVPLLLYLAARKGYGMDRVTQAASQLRDRLPDRKQLRDAATDLTGYRNGNAISQRLRELIGSKS
jgi:NAD(P)-dependent dehydrogenase (short-subunit alcohol dehydrogenase family)